MKNSIEIRYVVVFLFSFIVVVLSLFLSIHKLQPLLFQHIFTSCTAVYQSITANALIISSAFVIGLLTVLVCLSLKLVLSSHRTSQSLAAFSDSAQKNFPRQLHTIIKKMNLNKRDIIITNHQRPLALTAGLLSPKIVLSKGLIKQLTEKELEAVLLHEIYHQQYKHGMLFVIAEAIAASLTMLVPVLRDVISNMKIDFENAADRYAVSYQGSTRHIASALSKLSTGTTPAYLPAFATVTTDRLALLNANSYKARKLNKLKLYFSIATLMILSFVAVMPMDTSKSIVYAEDSTNVCVRRVNIGMSKTQNSSSILPASMF